MYDAEADVEFQQEKDKYRTLLENRLCRAAGKLVQLKKEQEKCLEWKTVQHEGQLLQTYFHLLQPGISQVTVQDWELDYSNRTISLDIHLTPQKQIEKFFRKSQKLKSGLKRLPLLIERADQEIMRLYSLLKILEEQENPAGLRLLCKEFIAIPQKSKKDAMPQSKNPPYRTYKTAAGLLIWVGKNAKGNDQLTFRFAKGSDWWLHVMGFAGSHVILRENKGNRPDEESLRDAVQLAIFYSQAKEQPVVEVCLTQRKYVNRIGKNQPGKVQLSKHEVIRTRFDKERYLAFMDRQ